jgi:hypothetical protein
MEKVGVLLKHGGKESLVREPLKCFLDRGQGMW